MHNSKNVDCLFKFIYSFDYRNFKRKVNVMRIYIYIRLRNEQNKKDRKFN